MGYPPTGKWKPRIGFARPQASIDRRNPFIDPLSFIQVELLSRLRDGDPGDQEQLGRVSLLTINGIASGLRNTG